MTCRAMTTRRKNGWPMKCGRRAIVRGYCSQHAEMNPAPRPSFWKPAPSTEAK